MPEVGDGETFSRASVVIVVHLTGKRRPMGTRARRLEAGSGARGAQAGASFRAGGTVATHQARSMIFSRSSSQCRAEPPCRSRGGAVTTENCRIDGRGPRFIPSSGPDRSQRPAGTGPLGELSSPSGEGAPDRSGSAAPSQGGVVLELGEPVD